VNNVVAKSSLAGCREAGPSVRSSHSGTWGAPCWNFCVQVGFGWKRLIQRPMSLSFKGGGGSCLSSFWCYTPVRLKLNAV
jgi:hypothetical protein